MAGLREVVPPASEPVSFEEAAQYVRLADDGDNRVLERLIVAARAHFEQGTRRALVTRTLEATFDQWPVVYPDYGRRVVQEPELILPFSPLAKVNKVEYLDLDQALQTVDAATVYKAVTNQDPGRIRRRKNALWPDTSDEPDSIIVNYDAGYGEDDDVPSDAKVAILMLVGHWYENREAVDVSTGGTVTNVPHGYAAIVNNLAVPRVV